jgi:hypothetical protein
MKLIFSEQARDDYLYWEKVDKKVGPKTAKACTLWLLVKTHQ